MPSLRGLHHLKVAVGDLDRAAAYYALALDGRRITDFDHLGQDSVPYAYVLEVPGLGCYLELRRHPARALRQSGFDAMTVAVGERADLETWIRRLDVAGLPHSPVLRALRSWLVVAEDPDGNRFRLYTLEEHRCDEPGDDDPWLRDDLVTDPDHPTGVDDAPIHER